MKALKRSVPASVVPAIVKNTARRIASIIMVMILAFSLIGSAPPVSYNGPQPYPGSTPYYGNTPTHPTQDDYVHEGASIVFDASGEIVEYYFGWDDDFCPEEFIASLFSDDAVGSVFCCCEVAGPEGFEAFGAFADPDYVTGFHLGWPEDYCPDEYIAAYIAAHYARLAAETGSIFEFGAWIDAASLEPFDESYEEPFVPLHGHGHYFGWPEGYCPDEYIAAYLEAHYARLAAESGAIFEFGAWIDAAGFAPFDESFEEPFVPLHGIDHYFGWPEGYCPDEYIAAYIARASAGAESTVEYCPDWLAAEAGLETFSAFIDPGYVVEYEGGWPEGYCPYEYIAAYIAAHYARLHSESGNIPDNDHGWETSPYLAPSGEVSEEMMYFYGFNYDEPIIMCMQTFYEIIDQYLATDVTGAYNQGGGVVPFTTNTLTVSPTSWLPGASAEHRTIGVTSNATWSIVSEVHWLTVENIRPANRTGNGSFQLNASANQGTGSRTGIVAVAVAGRPGINIRVTQSAPVPPATLTVSPSTWNQQSAGGSTSVTVTSNATWTVTSNATTWLTVSNISPANRTGNGRFTINASANNGTAQRTGAITVTVPGITRTINVTQVAPAAVLTVSHANWHLTSQAAGSISIGVTSNRSWSASSNATWLTLDNVSSINRTGNSTFTLRATTANTSTLPRTATVTISTGGITRTITVTQPPPPTLSLSVTDWEVLISGGNAPVTVTSNATWTVSSNQSWLTISNTTPANRTGNGSFRMNVSANSGQDVRRGVITATAPGAPTRTISVAQAAPPPVLSLSTSTWSIASASNSSTVNVTSNRTWTVTSSNTSWLTVNNITPTNRTGNGSFRINATTNTGPLRQGTITVTAPGVPARTITVTQGAQPSLTISPTSWSPPSALSHNIVSVSSNTTWSISSNANWLTFDSVTPASRTGSGQFRITASANTGTSSRTGTISVTATGVPTRTISVTQGAMPNLTISPANWNAPSTLSHTIVNVTSNIQWSASSSASWLTFDNVTPPSGSSNGQFRITAAANTGTASRTGTITVSGTGVTARTVSVTQAVPPAVLTLSTSAWNSPSSVSFATIDVTSNRTWAVSSDVSWLTISNVTPANRTGNGSFRITAAANTSTGVNPRRGTITVTADGLTRTVTVSQAPVASLTISRDASWNPTHTSSHTTVMVLSNMTWSVTSDSSWIIINNIIPINQTGNGSFRVDLTANTTTAPRTGTVTVTAPGAPTRTVTFTQPAPPAALVLSTDEWHTGSLAGNARVNVTSNRTWTVTSQQLWLTVDSFSPASRTGDGSFRINATVNLDAIHRLGTVTVSAPGAPTRIIAVVQAPRATVIFHPNDGAFGPGVGTGGVVRQQVHTNTPVGTLPPSPTRLGHTFAGWFTTDERTGGTQILPSSPLITGDTTLWARWTPINFTVTLDVNDGVGGPPPRIVPFREPFGALPPEPTKGGHDFLGWFISPTGGYQLTANTLVTDNITYWARWAPRNLSVSFNTNGGGTAPPTREVRFGGEVGPLPNITRSGYTLNGWFTQHTGGIQITENRIISTNVTFYAQWRRNDVTVTFNPTGGIVSPTSRTVQRGTEIGTLPVPTRSGYVFIGWHMGSNLGMLVTASTIINYDTTLYAVWDANSFTITLNANGGNVYPASVTRLAGAEVGILPTPTRTGHAFLGWYDARGVRLQPTDRVNSNITAYARWDGLSITFNSNGGEAVTPAVRPITQGNTVGPLPRAPRRQGQTLGHTFVGWFTHPTYGGTEITANTVVGDSSITAYARWACNAQLWPTRISQTRRWYHSNDISLQHLSFTPNHIPLQNRTAWANAVTQGADNWSNSAAPVNFRFSAFSSNVVETYDFSDVGGSGRILGTHGILDREDGVVSLFRVRLCPVNIQWLVDYRDHDLNTLIAFVMVHELGHALGLRDGYQRDGHPTILGGSMLGSIMNSSMDLPLNGITSPTTFDIASVRLVYDDLP